MTNRSTPNATFLSDRSVELRFPYLAWLVEDIKSHIPAAYREWEPSRKVWIVTGPTADWAEFAVDLLQRHFPSARVYRSGASATPRSDDDFGALHLMPTAPPALVRAARRTLALEYHPDRGGSHEQMVAINLAYERLEAQGCA